MDRLEIVRALIEMQTPMQESIDKLATLEWNYDGDGIELNRTHLINVLNKFLSNKLSDSDVEKWANAIESREDIRFESGNERKIEEVIYELANPILTFPLDIPRARFLLDALAGKTDQC
jgi:hypothetical protein